MHNVLAMVILPYTAFFFQIQTKVHFQNERFGLAILYLSISENGLLCPEISFKFNFTTLFQLANKKRRPTSNSLNNTKQRPVNSFHNKEQKRPMTNSLNNKKQRPEINSLNKLNKKNKVAKKRDEETQSKLLMIHIICDK